MKSSSMVSLFSEQPALNERPYSFVVSIFVHSTAIGLVYFGIISAPRVKTPVVTEHYTVRHIDLQTIESEMQRAARSAIQAPRARSKASAPAHAAASAAAQQQADAQPDTQAMRMVMQAPPAPQTLVQPDIPKPVALTVEIPVPTVVLWDGKNFPAKTLVAPLPAPPPVADVKPSIQLPNEEQRLADIAIPAVELSTQVSPVLPSTTTPVVVQGPKPNPPAPITTAVSAAQPTPAAVLSLSEHRMTTGVVTLPPVNQSASPNSPGAISTGQAKPSPQTSKVNPANKADSKTPSNASGKPGVPGAKETAKAPGSGNAAAPSASANTIASAAPVSPGPNAPPAPTSQEANSGSGLGSSPPGTTRIMLPKEGKFGSVVVGSSLEDKYPETAQLMSGKLAYTVYLHVGTPRNWILQYSLPRADEAAQAGNTTHIEAPWPYNIVRPNIAPGVIDADALIVHGFVNQEGRFEGLTIAFPPDFTQAKFVLGSLALWQFRPATQNGQNIKVEVLLIIPEEQE